MIWIGTSGYNYPEWKGTFYPADLPVSKMLPYYAERFPTVEVNYTFYRMPTAKIVCGWAAAVPADFRFSMKAPKRITHVAKLRDCDDLVKAFLDAGTALGPQLGPVLFQLAPTHKKDLAALQSFAALLPPHARAAFEFRHPSWFDGEVFDTLRSHNLALCVADSEKLSTPVEITADYAYFRLRDEGYQAVDIDRWAAVIRERTAACRDAFVYFKHEESGKGPAFAKMLGETHRAGPAGTDRRCPRLAGGTRRTARGRVSRGGHRHAPGAVRRRRRLKARQPAAQFRPTTSSAKRTTVRSAQ